MIPKFRAWDKELKTMLDVSLIDFKKGVLVGEHWKFGETNFMSFDEIELMQSTGLKDDFDKEIFEGDVILWTYWDEFEDSGRAKVIFDKGMFKLLDIRTEKEVWDNLFDCIENCNVYLQGNIYENKGILEENE
jgi:uncharacterized phage protein (TIGR01671 family)